MSATGALVDHGNGDGFAVVRTVDVDLGAADGVAVGQGAELGCIEGDDQLVVAVGGSASTETDGVVSGLTGVVVRAGGARARARVRALRSSSGRSGGGSLRSGSGSRSFSGRSLSSGRGGSLGGGRGRGLSGRGGGLSGRGSLGSLRRGSLSGRGGGSGL